MFTASFSKSLGSGSGFESLASSKYRDSLAAEEVCFDLAELTTIDTYSAAALLSWAFELRSLGKPVHFKLPKRERRFPTEVGVVFDTLQLGAALSDFGIHIDSEPTLFSHDDNFYGYSSVGSVEKIDVILEQFTSDFSTGSENAGFDSAISSVILKELLQNGLTHGVPKSFHQPYFFARSLGLSSKASIADSINDGFVEICVGDFGKGIDRTINNAVPLDYKPPFDFGRHPYAVENSLCYAFEFSSTSDTKSRHERIKYLLTRQGEYDLSKVATGLYCVLNVVQRYSGQLQIRTPKASLTFDYSNEGRLRFRSALHSRRSSSSGRSLINTKTFAPIKGSHFVLRFGTSKSRLSQTYSSASRTMLPRDSMKLIAPFALRATKDADHSHVLSSAISEIDKELIKRRSGKGTLIIDAYGTSLDAKSNSLLLYSLQNMNAGHQSIIVANPDYQVQETKWADSFYVSTHHIISGDPFRNEFVSHSNPQDDGESHGYTRLPDEAREEMVRQLGDSARRRISRDLDFETVQVAPGPFLLENRYYTNVFFNISKLLDFKKHNSLFANWLVAQIQDVPEVIFAHSELMLKPAEEIANRILSRWDSRPEVVLIPTPLDNSRLATVVIGHYSSKYIVVTDVLGSGHSINSVLDSLNPKTCSGVFTFVDTRDDTGRTIEQSVYSIVKKPVHKWTDFSEALNAARAAFPQNTVLEDRQIVIDQSTHTPTLFLRDSKTRYPVDTFADFANEAGALLEGHIEYDRHHYQYFIDFARLFGYYKTEITNWVVHQVEESARRWSNNNLDDISVDIYFLGNDSYLNWLPKQYALHNESIQSTDFHPLSHDKISLPEPVMSSSPSNKLAVGILPAIKTGRTAHKYYEYLSRKSPKGILILTIVLRCDPSQETFLKGIDHYKSIPTLFAAFSEFDVPGQLGTSSECPQCSLSRRLQATRASMFSTEDPSPLAEALSSKIAELQAQSFEYDSTARPTKSSPRSSHRALIRSLYSRSEVDIHIRKRLNQLLQSDNTYIDRFLECVNVEPFSREYRREVINTRLYSSMQLIEERVNQIAKKAPPFPIGKYILASEVLCPGFIEDNGYSILNNFKTDQRSLEEFSVACIAHDITVPSPNDWSDLVESFGPGTEKDLVKDLSRILVKNRDLYSTTLSSALPSIQELNAHFVRSSPFYDNRVALQNRLYGIVEDEVDDEVLNLVSLIYKYYTTDVLPIIEKIKGSPLWQIINKNSFTLKSQFRDLDVYFNRLRVQSLSTALTTTEYSRETIALLNAISELYEDIQEQLSGFIHRPSTSPFLVSLGDFETHSGTKVKLTKLIDHDSRCIFIDNDDIKWVYSEVVANWKKHGSTSHSINAVISLTGAGDIVDITFGDDIEGSYQFGETEGGLHRVKSICYKYGFELRVNGETQIGDIFTSKSLTLSCPSVKHH